MRVLAWTLVWAVLLALAAWYLWVRLRRVWAQARDLADTLRHAEQLIAQVPAVAPAPTRSVLGPASGSVLDGASGLVPDGPRPDAGQELAVFRHPLDALVERERVRERSRREREQRRASRLPGWARRVDSNARPPRKADP